MRLLLLSLTIITVCFAADSSALAYFSATKLPEYRGVDRTAPTGSANKLFLPDNITSKGLFAQNSMLISADRNIVPSDIIDLNISLYNAMQNPVAPQDSVANTLYANIKLKTILDDYAKIQQQAKKLLADTDMNLGAGYTPTDLGSVTNMIKAINQINQEFRGLAQHITAKISTAENTPPPRTLTSVLPIPPEISKEQRISTAANTYLRDIMPNQYQVDAPTQQAAPRQHGTNQSFYYEDLTLPWIIRFPLSIFHYLLSHVVESIIYSLLLIIGVSIISTSRSPK